MAISGKTRLHISVPMMPFATEDNTWPSDSLPVSACDAGAGSKKC